MSEGVGLQVRQNLANQRLSRGAFTGWVGLLAVSHLRNTVEQLKFSGYDIELWVGRGIFTRPFSVKGDRVAVDQVMRWVSAVNQAATA